MDRVAAFTDTYLPTVNGVTYTVWAWRAGWRRRGRRMMVAYPDAADHDAAADEVPVRSLPFPFYDGYRLALPQVPRAVIGADLVHVHTPFSLGVAGLRLARRRDLPVVASYHTPIGEYANYLAPTRSVAAAIRHVGERWERAFLDRADVVTAPSETTRRHLVETVGASAPVRVVPNGVDTDWFAPTDPSAFTAVHDLDVETPLVGYTGRHGYEKRLDELIDAAADLDVTLAFGGDGPARADLEDRAEARGVDAHFLGFLDRADLPAFYAALDAFAFPSAVETQGLVALEAMACGTPVVAARAGALVETVDDGHTGYHFDPGDVTSFREAIGRALDRQTVLGETCLDRREETSVERSVDQLEAVYASVL